MTDDELDALCDQARDLWLADNAEPAIALWRRAADGGSARGMYNLGVVAESRGDKEEACRQYELAAAFDPPYPLALYNLSVIALSDKEMERAASLAEQAAEAGVALAAFNRGQMASWESDISTAQRWWELADELGDDGAAAYNLGIHANDDGDRDAARHWFQHSAEKGYPDGMNNFGVFLRQEGDLAGSLELYERAAAAGSALARSNLDELAAEERRNRPAPPAASRRAAASWQSARPAPADATGSASATGQASSFCTGCGQALSPGARFCAECGAARP